MKIETNRDGSTMKMKIAGWLDATAAPVLGEAIDNIPPEISKLILDCSELEYISSSGLRMFLTAHKKMSGKDGLEITGLNSDIKNVLDMTGFLTRLNVQ